MLSPSGRCIRFGVFEFNAQAEELRKRGLKVKIGPLPCRALALLLEYPGKLYTRQELCERLWPAGVFVDFEHSLNKTIHALRTALDDAPAAPRYIETVAGKGYRFIPAMQPPTHALNSKTPRKVGSVAVLPFNATGASSESPLLASQITSQLTNALAKIDGIVVLAHNTVKHCDLNGRSPQEIGKQLGVRAVVLGEILCSPDGLISNVEVIDVANGCQLWGGQIIQPEIHEMDCSEKVVKRILRQLQPIFSNTASKVVPVLSKRALTGIRIVEPITAKLSFFSA